MRDFVQQEIATEDGVHVTARLFQPQGEPRALVLIAGAMAVAQTFYAPLAKWLAAQGYLTATFDYRGMGLSRKQHPRDTSASIDDWAGRDCAAVLEALATRAQGKPVYWVGHSLGGQIVALVPNWNKVAKVVTIATGSGYWRQNTVPLRYFVWLLWYVLAPVSVNLVGYFPGRRLRVVGDLPAPVMRQWRRWCLDPEYVVGAEGERVRALYKQMDAPIVSLSFPDDELMSARGVETLHGLYSTAPRTMRRIHASESGARRIGHFGFFRPQFADTLWRSYLLPELC